MTKHPIDRLQVRACAVLWDGDSLLVQSPRENLSRYALPGGRVETGETFTDCLRRELREELAVEIEPQRLLFVHENFFNDEGVLTQEYGFYFLCQTPHPSAQLRAKTAQPLEPQLTFRWIEKKALPQLPLFPPFLREWLLKPLSAIQFFSTSDAG